MAAQHEQAAGAASSERSAASSLFREVAEVVVLAVILYVGISFAVQADNRNRSQDSRFVGPISRDRIDGKAWFRIWPIKNFGNIYDKVPVLESGTTFAGSRRPATA